MPSPSTPVRYPGGVTNVNSGDPWAMVGIPDPTKWYTFFDDFTDYQAAQWILTVTEAGAGAAAVNTTSATEGIYGKLSITNDDGAADAVFMQWAGVDSAAVVLPFLYRVGGQIAFKWRAKVDNATLCDVIAGTCVADTTPLATGGDAVFFRKSAATTTINFVVTLASVETVTPVGTLVDDTYIELAYYWNGYKFDIFVNGVKKASLTPTAAFSTARQTFTQGIKNGSAAARLMTVDYIAIADKRAGAGIY